RGHDDQVVALAFNPRDGLLASAAKDNSVRIWDVAKERMVHKLDLPTPARALAFSADHPLLAAADAQGHIHLCACPKPSPAKIWQPQKGGVHALAFAPEGHLLASGGADDRAYTWDVRTGNQVHEFKDHANAVTAVAFNAKGTLLATACRD